MQKTIKYGVIGKVTAVALAILITLSCMVPLGHITNVGATNILTSDDSEVSNVTAQPTVSESVLSNITTNDTDKQVKEPSQGQNADGTYSVVSDFGDNILGVKATYYDYLSDVEYNGKWLHPIPAGTNFYSDDNWYPFYIFNQKLSNVARNNTSWSSPLYFGNFCNTAGAYPNGTDHNSGGWTHVTNDTNAYNFNYIPNNSNAVYDSYTSVQGLVYPELVGNNLMVTANQKAPYFDGEWLIRENIGKVIKGEFPFRITKHTEGNYEYNEYSFNSNGAKDNVYFEWANNNGTYPTTVKYGTSDNNSYAGIDDGYYNFMGFNKQGSSKGIFPFNNCQGTAGSKDSNENLNYGFGIRMDIDFRVPKGGIIPGTSKPVQFEFTGDDDLWVYITDNETGKSQLVLDMGGAHKESHGIIDFSTKKATVDKVHNPNGTNRDIYIEDWSEWGNVRIWAWSDSKGGEWYYGDQSNNIYRFRETLIGSNGTPLNQMTKFKAVKNEWQAQSDEYRLSDYWGKRTWTNNMGGKADSGKTSGNAETKVKSFSFENDDDQKNYTMTVFYMERGLIESNMKINFTMAPLTNDLTVEKEVNTANVNAGLVDELKNNEVFTYTAYNGPENSNFDTIPVATNKVYNTDQSTGSTGTFTLQDKGSAYFDDQFETNSKMKFVEGEELESDLSDDTSGTLSKSGLCYDINWELTDNTVSDTANPIIESGTTGTAEFDMINKVNDESKRTSLNLKYVNTPKVAPLTVKKTVVDSNDNDISDSTDTVFNYNILLDLYEGENNYNGNLTLDYKLYDSNGAFVDNYPTTNGAFSLKGGQYAVFEGIPVNTNYKIVEQQADGYTLKDVKLGGTAVTTQNNTVSSWINTTGNTVTFINEYNPATTTLTASKTLGGEAYTGNEFTFNVSGMPSQRVNGVTTEDTSSVSLNVNTVTNGVVTFANTETNKPFTYNNAGTYCYKITETAGTDTNYIYDNAVYYAKVVVTPDENGELKVSDLAYYSDATFQKSADPVFANEYANCTVVVYKTNYNDTILIDGAEFKLVPAKKVGNNWVQDTSKQAYGPVEVKDAFEGAVFSDIPQGDYLVIETKAPEGYELSTKEIYVKAERNSNNQPVVVTFSDTNTFLLPKAGGNGNSNVYVYAGIVSMGLAFIFFSVGRKTSTAKKGCK